MSIASEITRLQGVKADILTAIGNKGVTVPVGSALDDCPGLIGNISSGTSASLCIVEVNSSSGDVVTATSGGTTIQSDTGRCFFCLPFSGTWVFVCNGVSKSVAISDNEYKYISFEETTVYQNGTQGISLVNGQNCTFDTDYISFTPGTGDYCSFVRTQNQITGINPKRIRGKFIRSSVEYTFDEELTEAISGKYLYITYQSTASYNAFCVGYDSNIVTPSPTAAEQIQLDYSTNAASNIRLKELYLY